jgi:hypothetical protein
LVLLGCLFVLAGIRAAYKFNVAFQGNKSTIETASPGLVLVTVGAMWMAASLYRSGSPMFTPVPCSGAVSSVLNPRLQP